VALVVAGGAAPAQDVVKVSPETHAVILDNAHVRVLSVRIKPGEEVAMHSHPPNVVYYLSDARIRLTLSDGKVEDRAVTAAWRCGATERFTLPRTWARASYVKFKSS